MRERCVRRKEEDGNDEKDEVEVDDEGR